MDFSKLFNFLARRAGFVATAPALSGNEPIISDIGNQGAEIDETQYYDTASRSLREAVTKLREGLVIGEIIERSDDDNPRTTRIITRYPPDNSLYAPEEGYIMEVFDVRVCKLNKNPLAVYEVNRWEIDSIYRLETVDGIIEGPTIHNLGQVLGTILRRSEGLVFFDNDPPAARGFAIGRLFDPS